MVDDDDEVDGLRDGVLERCGFAYGAYFALRDAGGSLIGAMVDHASCLVSGCELWAESSQVS